jgi:hypothetical protein
VFERVFIIIIIEKIKFITTVNVNQNLNLVQFFGTGESFGFGLRNNKN